MVGLNQNDVKDIGRDTACQTTSKGARVVIVGAGSGCCVAGIITAVRLKKKLGFQDFTIFEKSSSVGGTWRDNTYPGCGCDIPGHFYSLSSELNPHWSTCYPTQPELKAYWEDLWTRYRLEPHTQLSTQVTFAKWNSERQLYEIDVQRQGGKTQRVEAEVLVYCVGGFQDVRYPTGLGDLKTFEGDMFHSGRWRYDVELKGKRVGVIGNGCSAAQFVPEISEDPSVRVFNFARTPHWYVPQGNFVYPPLVKWIFAHIPGAMRIYRNWLMFRSDIVSVMFNKDNTFVINAMRKLLIKYIKHKAPKEYIEKLTPSYAPGCKRLILDPGYLECLHRPNVSLTFDAIDCVVEEGIKLKSGEVVPLDVIIFGTGYSLEAVGLNAVGREGTTVRDYFVKHRAPRAYLGSCYPGFPNLYTILGPNVAVGHSSVIFSQEAQIDYILQLMKPVLDGTAKSFEVTDQATDDYNAWLQKRLARTVWTECLSFYNEVNGKKGAIFANFPGSITLFWWMTLTPKWKAFKAVGAEAWERQRRYRQWGTLALLVSVAVGVASFIRN